MIKIQTARDNIKHYTKRLALPKISDYERKLVSEEIAINTKTIQTRISIYKEIIDYTLWANCPDKEEINSLKGKHLTDKEFIEFAKVNTKDDLTIIKNETAKHWKEYNFKTIHELFAVNPLEPIKELIKEGIYSNDLEKETCIVFEPEFAAENFAYDPDGMDF